MRTASQGFQLGVPQGFRLFLPLRVPIRDLGKVHRAKSNLEIRPSIVGTPLFFAALLYKFGTFVFTLSLGLGSGAVELDRSNNTG